MPLDHLRSADRHDLVQYAARLEWILEEFMVAPADEEQLAFVRKELQGLRRRLDEKNRQRRLKR